MVNVAALSAVLGRANLIPPCFDPARRRFFELKRHILQLHGAKLDKVVVQHIRKDCWNCCGTGLWTGYLGLREKCRKCRGSGVFEDIYIHHEQWQLGRRLFLSPIARKVAHLGDVDIEGSVRWGGNPKHVELCRNTLALVFAPAEFWRVNNPLIVGFKAKMRVMEKIAYAIGSVPAENHLYFKDDDRDVPF